MPLKNRIVKVQPAVQQAAFIDQLKTNLTKRTIDEEVWTKNRE
jgi:hypothetical protein